MKNYISVIDIINWLYNFHEEDRYDMLELLKQFRYFTDIDVVEGFRNSIENIFNSIETTQIVTINPIGKYGKSGTGMIYFLKKAIAGLKGYKIEKVYTSNLNDEINEKANKKNNKEALILVDDFIGSGENVKKYYDENYMEIAKYKRVIILTFACTDNGYNYLSQKLKCVEIKYSELETKIFSTKSDTLGKRDKIKRIREIAYKYSKDNQLYVKKKKNSYLGVGNAQCLIAFSFGTPNNTLPIFWSSNNNWYPLFPRFIDNRINKIRQIRKDICFELSVSYTLGLDLFKSIDKNIDIQKRIVLKKVNYQMLALIKFKLQKKGTLCICRSLGISFEDYKLIIEKAKTKNLIDNEENLTILAKDTYMDIMNKVSNYKRELKKYDEYNSLNNDEIYVPSIFCGKS